VQRPQRPDQQGPGGGQVEQKGDWVKVSHPDLTGWVHKDLVWP
jgi:hypothetical protein